MGLKGFFFGVLVVATSAVGGCSSKEAQCQDFIAEVETCYDNHCDSSNSAFCDCWNQGQDINIVDCECVPLNLDPVCDSVDLPATLDCSVASASVDNFCN